MIILLTGLPGSGKSLKASKMIYDLAYDVKSKDYKKRKRVYTNLDQFDFDKCNHETDIEFIPYSMETLHENLSDLYMMREESDDVLLEYCESKHLNDAYYIIDEAHNDFMKQDKVLIWWLSYHRHLHQDIVLITQNKTLINSYYRHFPEFFYHAQPASKRIFNRSARYKVYSSFGHFKKDLIKTETVKIDKKYFSLYHSGDHSKPVNIIRRFAFIALILSVLTVVSFKASLYFISGGDPVSNVASKNIATIEKNETVKPERVRLLSRDEPVGRDILLMITCSNNECWDGYLNTYPVEKISEFMKKENTEMLYQETVYSDSTLRIRRFSIRTNKDNLRKYLFRYFNSDKELQEGFIGDETKTLGV
jgi:zona occludens toxin